jgi:hypothetical protein
VTDPPTHTFPPPTAISERLITQNLGLARKQASYYYCKTGQPYDDLEAIAYLGLIRGCRRYDPEKVNPRSGQPYALSTIVVPFISGEILHWFRDKGYSINFPYKWREKWGKVRRLMADPDLSAQDVAEQSGMSLEEIEEMLAAMTANANLDDLHGADAVHDPEVSICAVAPLLALIRRAWDVMHAGDAAQVIAWWANPRKLAYPSGPLQQFHNRLRHLLRGQTLSQVLQLSLSLEVQPQPVQPRPKPPRRRRNRAELDAAVVQLGLVAG